MIAESSERRPGRSLAPSSAAPVEGTDSLFDFGKGCSIRLPVRSRTNLSWVADTFAIMSTTTLIGGEPFDVLVGLLDLLHVRRKPSRWYDISAVLPASLGDSVVRAIDAITAEIRMDPELRVPDALRADAFVELVQRISEEMHRAEAR